MRLPDFFNALEALQSAAQEIMRLEESLLGTTSISQAELDAVCATASVGIGYKLGAREANPYLFHMRLHGGFMVDTVIDTDEIFKSFMSGW